MTVTERPVPVTGVFGEGGGPVELPWFIAAFNRAATVCHDFAQRFVTEQLPASLR